MKLILASQSEWRKRLISWLKVPFEVVVSDVDESLYKSDEPDELVAMLATAKAEAVVNLNRVRKNSKEEECLVIGADTMIVIDDEVIGKPRDRGDAKGIVGRLQGREHKVYTGLCVINGLTGERRVGVEETTVAMAAMNEAEIEKLKNTNVIQ